MSPFRLDYLQTCNNLKKMKKKKVNFINNLFIFILMLL